MRTTAFALASHDVGKLNIAMLVYYKATLTHAFPVSKCIPDA